MCFNSFACTAAAPTANHEWAPTFTLRPQLALNAAVTTAALSDQFYETADARLLCLRGFGGQKRAALYGVAGGVCTRAAALALVPLVPATELARVHNGDNTAARLVVSPCHIAPVECKPYATFGAE